MLKYVDAHCHAYEYSLNELNQYKQILLLSVGDDYRSSLRNIELESKYNNIIGGVGAHPWSIGYEVSLDDVNNIIELALNSRPKMIGEIGLDKKFKSNTFELQRIVFKKFLELVNTLGNVIVNVHALGAWKEVLNELMKYNIKVAIIHWYTGPKQLLKEIEAQNYYITINPSILFQKKHQNILKEASLDIILTESDGPYEYRGHILRSNLIPEVLKFIAKVKELDIEEVRKTIINNIKRLLSILNMSMEFEY